MANFGTFEMVILLVVVLIIFGPKSLPKIGQALGKGIREFKDATRGLTQDTDDEPPRRSSISHGSVETVTPTPTATEAQPTSTPNPS